MKIAVASDHRGVEAKARILEMVRELGHDGLDYGPETEESVDYPDFAAKVAGDVAASSLDRGILICGTGIGMCIAANKFAPLMRAMTSMPSSVACTTTPTCFVFPPT